MQKESRHRPDPPSRSAVVIPLSGERIDWRSDRPVKRQICETFAGESIVSEIFPVKLSPVKGCVLERSCVHDRGPPEAQEVSKAVVA